MSSKDTIKVTRDKDDHADKIIKTHENDDEIITKEYRAEHGFLGLKEGHKLRETREKKSK